MNRMNIKHEDSPDPNFDETRWSKRLHSTDASIPEEEDQSQRKRQKVMISKKKEQDLSTVKVKTLAEIRAEKRRQEQSDNANRPSSPLADSISEVSSTSKMEEDEHVEDEAKSTIEPFVKPMKRKSSMVQEQKKKPKLRRTPQLLQMENVVSSIEENVDSLSQRNSNADESENAKGRDNAKCSESEHVKAARADSVDSSKMDEMLLLDEDDFESSNVSLQAEEDLLKDIDDILSE